VTFNYEERIFATPVITLPIVDQAVEELEWVVERGARVVLIRPAPVPGYQGPRSMGLPEFDPFWAKVVEHDVLVAMHSSDSGYERYANDWMGSGSEMLPFHPQAFPDAVGLAAEDRGTAVSAMICHGALSRFPTFEVGCGRERQHLGGTAAAQTWPTCTRRCRSDILEDTSRGLQAERSTSARSGRRTWGALADLIGRSRALRL